MSKNAWWAWTIKNSIDIICWTALAIVFNKWWIALFAALFVSSLQTTGRKHYRICDECGRHSPYADSYNEAIDKSEKAGWIHYPKSNEDICPNCQKLIKTSK